MNSLKLSHTQANKYMTCAKSYQYHYIDKIRPQENPSALLFGSAFDTALNVAMANIKDCLNLDFRAAFIDSWTSAEVNKQIIQLKHCLDIQYNKNDLDLNILPTEANTQYLKFLMGKRARAEEMTKEELSTLHSWTWESMKIKGLLMLDTFENDFLPLIEKVLEIQAPIILESHDGDSIQGFADAVVKFKDREHPTVIDFKTTSFAYSEDSVLSSQQLSLYIFSLYDKYSTREAGYVTFSKKLEEEGTKICGKCGTDGKGKRHKTCDVELDKVRCNGEWEIKSTFRSPLQVIRSEIPERTEEIVLENFEQIASGIKNKHFYRNFEACVNKYNRRCAYYNLCYKNDNTGLTVN